MLPSNRLALLSGPYDRSPNVRNIVTITSISLIALAFALWAIKPVGDPILTAVAYGAFSLGSVFAILFRGPRIERRIGILFVITLGVAAIWGMYGLLRGNAGAGSELVFFLVLPIVWLVGAAGTSLGSVRILIAILPFVALLIGVLGSLYYLQQVGVPGLGWVTVFPLGQGAGLPGDRDYGFVLTFFPLASLTFLVPFVLVSLFVPGTFIWKASRIVAWPALLAMLFLLFVSGRRALFFSFALAVVAVFFLLFLGPSERRTRRRFYVVAAATTVAVLLITSVSHFSFGAMIASVFEDLNSPDSPRAKSGQALLGSLGQSPVFGHGLGATVGGAIRDKAHPWNFELQYHLMLNVFGSVGFLVIALATAALVTIGVLAYRRNRANSAFLAPIIAGTIATLIANASNPYLHTPGQYWMFYILVVAVNAVLAYSPILKMAQTNDIAPEAEGDTSDDR